MRNRPLCSAAHLRVLYGLRYIEPANLRVFGVLALEREPMDPRLAG
jgi:hypothetical protein